MRINRWSSFWASLLFKDDIYLILTFTKQLLYDLFILPKQKWFYTLSLEYFQLISVYSNTCINFSQLYWAVAYKVLL